MSDANVRLPPAMHYFVMLHYIRQPFLNANFNTGSVIGCTSLVPRVLCIAVQNVRDASPANLYPGTELTQTAADGIITSFPTFPGTSCLANLTVSLYLGLDKARHEVFERVRGQLLCHQREYKRSVESDPAVRFIHSR